MLEMFSDQLKTTLWVSVAGVISAAVTTLVAKRADKHKDELSEHLQLRKELREELDSVKEEYSEAIKSLDEWKSKYYAQVELTNRLLQQVSILESRLDMVIEELTNLRKTE